MNANLRITLLCVTVSGYLSSEDTGTTFWQAVKMIRNGNVPTQIWHITVSGIKKELVDENGVTLLMHAAMEQDPKVFLALLKEGLDPMARNNNNTTVLMFAAMYGRNSNIQTLLKNSMVKTQVNNQNESGTTALMFATQYGDLASVKTLLQAEANPNLQDTKGHTAYYNTGYAYITLDTTHYTEVQREAVIRGMQTALNRAGYVGSEEVAQINKGTE